MLYHNNANINVNIERSDGELTFSPLSAAILTSNIEIIRFLLDHGADPNLVNERDMTPLHLAISLKNFQLLIAMIKIYHADVNIPYGGNTPLHYACTWMKIEAIDILLDHGADPNQRDNVGNTPLHKMIRVFANDWENSIKKTMYKFIDHNFAINSQNQSGNTVLHLLIQWSQNHGILKHWLSKGAAINIANHSGFTPLQIAYHSGNDDIINFIRKYQ